MLLSVLSSLSTRFLVEVLLIASHPSPGLWNGIHGLPGTALLQVHEDDDRVQIQHVAPDSWGLWVRNAILTAGIRLKAASMVRRPGGENRRERLCGDMDKRTHAVCRRVWKDSLQGPWVAHAPFLPPPPLFYSLFSQLPGSF